MKYQVIRVYPRIGWARIGIVRDVVYETNNRDEAYTIAEWFKTKMSERDPSLIYVCEEEDCDDVTESL